MFFLALLESADLSKLIVAIVIIVIVLGIGIGLFIFFAGIKHVKKQVNDLSERYDSLHNLLIVQLDSDLKRVNNISQINEEYESIYSLNKNLFDDILNQEDAAALNAINDLNRLLSEKKYKLIKDEIEDVKIKVDQLSDKCNRLSKSVNDIINTDDDNRQEILRYRREFREIRDDYDSHRNELRYIEESFTTVFDKIESYFVEAEKLLAGAHYVESKEKFPEIDHVIKALRKAIQTLPKLTTLTFVVMPNNIDELVKKYEELNSQGYPLHHLKFQSNIDSFNVSLEKIKGKLALFQSKNAEFELNQIRDAIMLLNDDLTAEIEAKKYYMEEFDKIYNGSYKIENKFIKLRRVIPEYKKTYLLKETCVDDLENIQREINELGAIKRRLDSYVHSSSQQPYSTLANKLKDLSDAMDNIEQDIDNAHKYLNSLKEDTDKDYACITETFVNLKKYECLLRKVSIPTVTATFKNEIAQCYRILNDCGEIISTMPIDVESLNNDVQRLIGGYSQLHDRIIVLPELMKKAEDSIVYANQYRQDFDDVRNTLLRAEKSFFEGDFVRTTDETITMLKKIRPETGK